MRIVETKVWTISEHPNPDACYDWIRNNWHNLNEHSVYEVVDSLKKLQEIIGGELDYSISSSPAPGEHISFKGYDRDVLNELNPNDYPLTGICWDYEVIAGLQEGYPHEVLKALHKDTEYSYTDEALYDFCEANEYEFTEEGAVM